ncbi:MAG: selenide, water dikinase SelD [Deltaproteobacteria bacterium]|nr:selenide, water dikinase SelD [Deltaproteobacteria bacterium]
MQPVYLDYNATTPIDPRVAEAMLPFVHEHFGNPSSSHPFGITAKQAVERARRQVAQMLRCGADEVIFTSGGTESNNYAVKGVAFAHGKRGNHIITSSIEHPAIVEVCRHLERKGFRVTFLPVDAHGLVSPEEVERAINPGTILITVMHANNEVGTVQPIKAIAEVAHRHGILFHTDAAQSVGKIPVHVDDLGVDLLTIAGHKLYAPKGVGVLYVRSGVELEKLIHGADHERNWRAGTENVIEIVGLGEACAMVHENLPAYHAHLKEMRDRLEAALRERFPHVRFNGHPERRLPNTCSVGFRGLEANTILSELSDVAASAGAACHSDRVDVSAVLTAMGVPMEYAMGTIRFSTGRFTSAAEIDRAVKRITEVVERLQPREAMVPVISEREPIRLTQYTHGLGCACKLRPQLLEEVLRRVPPPADPDVLVGVDTSDDAAVYRIDHSTAIVQTVDFFTPVVDNPFQFGVVAAVNSLSDIYAMGAKPLFALSIVGFPSNRLPMWVLEEILKGAQSVAADAGISVIGGHTVDDTEPKFGLAVTGTVHPGRILKNVGARPGDALVLTKPIGTGILSTALKQGMLDESGSEALFRVMATLNKGAAEVMESFEVHACTDVTGFGLLGHLLEMMKGSGVSGQVRASAVPLLPGVLDLATGGVIPGGTQNNHDYTAPYVAYEEKISAVQRLFLNDAQTSGGLLVSLEEEKADVFLKALEAKGVASASKIGVVIPEGSHKIEVRE